MDTEAIERVEAKLDRIVEKRAREAGDANRVEAATEAKGDTDAA